MSRQLEQTLRSLTEVAPVFAALQAQGIVGNDTYGPYWRAPGSTTLLRSLMPEQTRIPAALLQRALDAALRVRGVLPSTEPLRRP